MKNIKRIFSILFLCAALLVSAITFAIPANKKPITKKQSNGSTITFVLQGDEHLNWAVTLDGYTLLANQNGDYVYAIKNNQGNLIASDVIATNENERKAVEKSFVANLQKDLRFSQEQIAAQYAKTSNVKDIFDNFPTTGTDSLLVILVSFSDVTFSYPQSNFQNLVSQTNYNTTGSFKDYYKDQSAGQLNLGIRVVGPYTLPHNMAYYGSNTNQSQNYINFVHDVVAAADPYVDFSHFDNNNDGYVDGIFIFYAGTPESTTGNADEIWPHQWVVTTSTNDGVTVARYACSSEKANEEGEMAGIGTMCHEFGHMLGLPDMYDTDYAGTGGQSVTTGTYDLMSGGGYNNGGATPCNLSIKEKTMLSWASVDTLSLTESKSNVEVTAVSGYNDKGYYVSLDGNDEFIMIETRSKESKWDGYIPSSGLLIYHGTHSKINAYVNNGTNDINIDPTDRGWYLIPSDGITAHGDQSLAPFAGVSEITSFSPNSLSKPQLNNGTSVDLRIMNIEWKNDSVIKFKYNVNTLAVEINTTDESEITQNGFTLHGKIISTGNQTLTKKGFIYSTSQNFTYSTGTVITDNTLSDTVDITATTNNLSSGKYYYKAFAIAGNDTAYSAVKSLYTKVLDVTDPVLSTMSDSQLRIDFDITKYSSCQKYTMIVASTNYLSYYANAYGMNEVDMMAYLIQLYNYQYNTSSGSYYYYGFEENADYTIFILAITTSGDTILYKKNFVTKFPGPEVTISDVENWIEYDKVNVKWSYTKNSYTDKYYAGIFNDNTVENYANQNNLSLNDILDDLISGGYLTEFSSDDSASYIVKPNIDFEIVVWAVNSTDTVFTKKTFNITKGGSGYASSSANLISVIDTIATVNITVNNQTAYYYLLGADDQSLNNAGITDTLTAYSYVQSNFNVNNQNIESKIVDWTGIKENTSYTLYVIPYNADDQVGKIAVLSFSTDTTSQNPDTNTTCQPVSITIDTAICWNETFTFKNKTHSSSCVIKDTTVNYLGCDSITTINLTIKAKPQGNETISICEGTTAQYNGNTYDKAGVFEVLISQNNGCDSVVYLSVKVNKTYTVNNYDTVEVSGQEDDYTLLDTTVLQTINGCDSTVITHTYYKHLASLQDIPINTLNIYPNPATDAVIIENVLCSTENITFNIYDTQGKLVLSETKPRAKSYKLSVEQLKSGIYYVKCGDKTQKLIIN